MATRNHTPSVARLIVAASRALDLYEAGNLAGALSALDGFHARPLPERPEWLATELERQSDAAMHGQPVPAAALDVSSWPGTGSARRWASRCSSPSCRFAWPCVAPERRWGPRPWPPSRSAATSGAPSSARRATRRRPRRSPRRAWPSAGHGRSSATSSLARSTTRASLSASPSAS